MSESDQPRPRPRWFQFDLRLLFVIVAAVGVILALEVARGSRQSSRKLLETLQVGDSVYLQERDGRWTISYHSNEPYLATIIEIGEDFVTVRDSTGTEFSLALSRIESVRRHAPSAPIKTNVPPRTVPKKTLSKTTDLLNPTGDRRIRKTSESP